LRTSAEDTPAARVEVELTLTLTLALTLTPNPNLGRRRDCGPRGSGAPTARAGRCTRRCRARCPRPRCSSPSRPPRPSRRSPSRPRSPSSPRPSRAGGGSGAADRGHAHRRLPQSGYFRRGGLRMACSPTRTHPPTPNLCSTTRFASLAVLLFSTFITLFAQLICINLTTQ